MELRILYEDNESGIRLFEKIEANHGQVECKRFELYDQPFLEIRVKDSNNGPLRRINTPKAVGNSIDPDDYCRMLNINGFTCGDQIDESIIKTYEVLLWGFKCLSFKVWSGARERGKVKALRERDNPKLVDTARRAMYVLGLDLGLVVIAYTARRRFKIMSVDSSPYLKEKDIEIISQKILDFTSLDLIVTQREVKLGADPEFMMFNSRTGKIVAASNHFPRDGIVGCDNIRMPNRTQRPIAELRPKPDNSPLVLTSNIKQALHIANQLAPFRNVRWVAGSQPGGSFSIGGHIHFSNTRLNASLLRALDNFLGLPIFLIENPATAVRRRKRYGRLGDYRTKDYGGFEYRTPASWLVSQNITLAILCLAKIVVSRYPWLPYNYLNDFYAQQAFYQGNQEYFLPVFEKLWKHLESVDMYEIYKEHIKVIYDMVTNQANWNESVDFRKAWMIPGGPRRSSRSRQQSDNSQGNDQGSPGELSGYLTQATGQVLVSRVDSSNSTSSGTGRIISPGQIRRTHRIR